MAGIKIPEDSCNYVMYLPFEERCSFIKNTEDCGFTPNDILKPYNWVFCAEDETMSYYGIVAMAICLVMLFLIISVIADAFVCPIVASIAETLNLSDNVAGVTILALGNGAPDFFTSLEGAERGHPEIVYAELTGSSLCIMGLIAGTILMARPFHIKAWPLVINTSFFLISYSILFIGFYTRNFGIYHSIAIVGVYVLYLVLTICIEIVDSKYEKSEGTREITERDARELDNMARNKGYFPPKEKYRASVGIELIKHIEKHKLYKEMGFRPSQLAGRGSSWKHCKPLFREFKEYTEGLVGPDFKTTSCIEKCHTILQAAIRFIVMFIIPVLSSDMPNDGWCKLILMMNAIIYPVFFLYIFDAAGTYAFGVPLVVYGLAGGFIVAVILFFTTKTYRLPMWHQSIAFIGFPGAVLMIDIVATEVVILIQTVGARFTVSNAFLTLTFLAIGNSLGDLVINYGLAKQGMQNMGFSACFGTPMFNCSFGVGFISIIVFIEGKPLRDYYGDLNPAGSLFIYITLGFTLITMLFLNFKGRSSFGLFLIIIYGVYFFLICLMERTIHPFGTQRFFTEK